MANSASDARASEEVIRQKLIESRAVDVIVAVGPNMFYTVTLPCTLSFFDQSKTGRRRREESQTSSAKGSQSLVTSTPTDGVDRAHRDWTPAQIGFLANLVRLYRGDALDFTLGGGEAKAKIEEVFGGAHAPSRVVDRAPAGNPERSARARTAAPGAGAIPIEEVFGGAHAPSRVVDRAPAGNPERSARARTAAPGAGAVPIQ